MIELVRRSPQPKRTTIAELGLARSTFYRWQHRYREQGEAGLVDRKPSPSTVWNRLAARGKDRDSRNRAAAARSEPAGTGLSSHRPCQLHRLRSHRVSSAETVWTESHDLAGGVSC